MHKAPAAAAGPEARWLRREFFAESTDSATNSLLALGLRCSASLVGHLCNPFYAYEPSIRVPLIVFDPRAPSSRRGVVCASVALNVDIAPSLLEIAGIDAPSATQGRSLVPLLRGEPPADWRTEFFYEHRFVHPRIPKSEGLRDERHTYIRWIDRSPTVEELYDRDADPLQARNLAAEPAWAATLADMRRRCDALRDRVGGATAAR